MNNRILVPWWYPWALAALAPLAALAGFAAGAVVEAIRCYR